MALAASPASSPPEFANCVLIGEGGYKTVFAIATSAGEEAVSVMDLEALRQNGLYVVAQQELQSSLWVSLLCQHHIAPLFSRIIDVCLLVFVHSQITRVTKLPTSLPVVSSSSDFLLIRMELANTGDCENYLRKVEGNKELVLCALFQIILSLYIAYEGVLLSRGNHT